MLDFDSIKTVGWHPLLQPISVTSLGSRSGKAAGVVLVTVM